MADITTQALPSEASPRLATRWRELRRYPLFPLAILVFFLVIPAVFAPLVAPFDPYQGSLRARLIPPFWQDGGTTEHLLGTDKLGRDMLSRVIYGARVSMTVSLIAIFVGGIIGTLLGVISGYFGGRTDSVIMRLVDISLSLPTILLALVLSAALGPSFMTVLIVISVLLWARYARLVRGETLAIKELDFIARARVAGASHMRIMRVYILPNLVNSLVVLATLQVGYVILLESTLSFLGAGLPRAEPAWGLMVADGRELIVTAWWVSMFPGIAILLTVLSLNLLGDWLRDHFDPKLKNL